MRDFERVLALDAMNLAYKLTNEIEGKGKNSGIAMLVVAKARDAAAIALMGLIDHDPADREGIQSLQAEVKRYCDMIPWLQQAIADGLDASVRLREEDESAVRDDIGWRTMNDEHPEQRDD